MIPTIAKKKLTLPFAHEFEKPKQKKETKKH